MILKEHLKNKLAENRFEDAIRDALRYIPSSDPMYADLIQYSARWEELERDARTQQNPSDEIRQQQNQLLHALISTAEDISPDIIYLPSEQHTIIPTGADAGNMPPKGISESRFKWHIFFGLILIKGFLLVYLFYIKESGGFLTTQYKTLTGLMLPVFTASFILMAKHLFDRRQQTHTTGGPYVNRANQLFSYLVLLFYSVLILVAINSFASKHADFDSLLNWINGTEVLLGGAIGYIVSTLFKKES